MAGLRAAPLVVMPLLRTTLVIVATAGLGWTPGFFVTGVGVACGSCCGFEEGDGDKTGERVGVKEGTILLTCENRIVKKMAPATMTTMIITPVRSFLSMFLNVVL